jgi:hypothetical protein
MERGNQNERDYYRYKKIAELNITLNNAEYHLIGLQCDITRRHLEDFIATKKKELQQLLRKND